MNTRPATSGIINPDIINPDIFKACDIRGDASRDLSPRLYRALGWGLASLVPSGTSMVVAGDVRASTLSFLLALCDGLREGGCPLLVLGIAPTPMIYFAVRTLLERGYPVAGCAIVTASHNPGSMNGLKWLIGNLPPDQAQIDALKQATFQKYSKRDAERSKIHARGEPAIESSDAFTLQHVYQHWLMSIKPRFNNELRIVIDPGGGSWAGRISPLIRCCFPSVQMVTINDEVDPTLLARDPDCSIPAHLTSLSEAVKWHQASLGIAFDGDGDRVAFVDDQGHALNPEESTWVLLQSLKFDLHGQTFCYDVKFSDRIKEFARSLGAITTPERSGQAFLFRKMQASNARFGAEVSGHYFWRELQGADDALFTACHLIDWLARSEVALSTLLQDCPPVFMTDDLRIPVDVMQRDAILKHVRDVFHDYPQSHIDGVRVDLENGWVLVRSSITQPTLTLRFEGTSPETLRSILQTFIQRVPMVADAIRPFLPNLFVEVAAIEAKQHG